MALMAESMAQQGLAGRLSGAEALYSRDPGIWCFEAYPAALMAGVYGEKRFLSDLAFFNVMFGGVFWKQPLMASLSREGTNVFSRNRLSISAGKKIGKGIQLGVNIGYASYNARGYPSLGEVNAGLGALLQLDERIRIGIQVNHMNDLREKKEFRFFFRTGIGYYLSDVCSIAIEITKESGRTVLTDAGIRYDFHPNIYARLGYSPALSLISFNIGYRDRQFRIEAGQAIHLSLGSTWGLSMMYIFNNEE
jgi:hypothetical protein